MKKVVYSVAKYGKNVSKITGVGYIAEDSLIISAISKNNSYKQNHRYYKIFYFHFIFQKQNYYS